MEGIRTSVDDHTDKMLPFVLYSKPNSTVVSGLFQQNSVLYKAEHFSESGFVFASFDGKLTHLIPESSSERIEFERSSLEKIVIEHTISETDEDSKVDFINLVALGIKAINEHQMKKVVLSRKELVVLVDFDLMDTFQNLLQLYPTAFVYCFYHPKIGTWLGATPEQLVRSEGENFETVSLAGTQKDTGTDEIKWQSKEKEEQQFVTDYIVGKLKDKTSFINVSEPYSIKAGMIWHIKTTVNAVFNKETKLKEIVQLLHPTPAVCGLPTAQAKEFIIKNELYGRKYYTGFLGELNKNTTNGTLTSDLFVNLRCMEIEGNHANVYVGCGITKDSSPEKEWEESRNKSVTMKRVLNSAKI
jgi:isochorismate synthase